MGDTKGEATPATRKAIDWERVEFDYRSGLLSLREIAAAHGCSHVAISKRSKAEGWERDLTAKIKAKADALVTKQVVTEAVNSQRAVTERETIQIGAETLAAVKLGRRSRVRRGQELSSKLWEEVALMTDNREALRQLGEFMYAPDDKGKDKLNEIYMAVIGTPERVDMLKKLTEAEGKLAVMEADAWSLKSAGEEPPDDDPFAGKSANEVARRLAFALHKGLQNQGGST